MDRRQLSVLMTALYIAKWESDDENSHVQEISGSPIFARLYNDAVDAMIALDSKKPDAVRKWHAWRSLEQRPEALDRTRSRIKQLTPWGTWTREQKLQMVMHLVSPFVATQSTLASLANL
jgi:hypothetical protein